MPESSPSGIAALLAAVRALPVWMLVGLALSGLGVLFLPTLAGIDPAGFRTHWGMWVWIETITFSILSVTRIVDAGISAYVAKRSDVENSRALRLFPEPHRCWWHHAKQQDDSYASQISMDIVASNVTDRPVRIVQARLASPRMKGGVLHADVSLPMAGSPYHSNKHAVPPHDTIRAALHIMIRGSLATQGKPVRVVVEIVDQLGSRYVLKVLLPTHDSRLPKVRIAKRLATKLRVFGILSGEQETASAAPESWQHGGKFDQVDVILNEERRSYAARGRQMGGLGSLNVTLQSEPNLGWTTQGNVPALLWPKDKAKRLDSPNVVTLLSLYDGLEDDAKRELEEYLLSHLNKLSRYADVGYFIFLALHRMQRTIDALMAARNHLSGDKVFGYSNLLGTLSALISHEHFDMNPSLYPQIQEALQGDKEHNFRLTEKINLARLENIAAGLRQAQSSAEPNPEPV